MKYNDRLTRRMTQRFETAKENNSRRPNEGLVWDDEYGWISKWTKREFELQRRRDEREQERQRRAAEIAERERQERITISLKKVKRQTRPLFEENDVGYKSVRKKKCKVQLLPEVPLRAVRRLEFEPAAADRDRAQPLDGGRVSGRSDDPAV